MSHEMLRQAAQHLQGSDNPSYQEGGRKLSLVADILLKDGLIPTTDQNVKLLLGEESILPPMFDAAEFCYDTVRGTFYKDGDVASSIGAMQKKLFERLILTPDQTVPTEDAVRYMYGFVDDSGMQTFKTHLSRLRGALPTTRERALEIIETISGVGVRYNHFPSE